MLFRKNKTTLDFPTSYNITISENPKDYGVPDIIFDLSVQAFKDAGFYGDFHVDNAGRLLPDYDPNCTRCYDAEFEVFGPRGDSASMQEIVK